MNCCQQCDDIDKEAKDVRTYELGKYWVGLGDYQKWKERKLAEFRKEYVLIHTIAWDTDTGDTELTARGYPIPKVTQEEIDEAISNDIDFHEHD